MTPHAVAMRERKAALRFLFGSRLLSTLSAAQKDFLPSAPSYNTPEQKEKNRLNMEKHRRARGVQPKKHGKRVWTMNEITDMNLRRRHGMSLSHATEKLLTQGNGCAICHQPLTIIKADVSLVVQSACADHDHVTKKFRGFLCRECNLGLGFLEDDPTRFSEAVTYLKGYLTPSNLTQLPKWTGERRPALRHQAAEDFRWSHYLSVQQKRLGFVFTREWVEAKLTSQNGRCAICHKCLLLLCREGAPDYAHRACIDHDHATGELRGFLCSDCNRGIGSFKDQVAIVRAAHLYLLSHRNNAAHSGNRNAEGNPAWIVTEGKTVKKGAA